MEEIPDSSRGNENSPRSPEIKLRKNEIKVPKNEIISPEEFLHASVENEKTPRRNLFFLHGVDLSLRDMGASSVAVHPAKEEVDPEVGDQHRHEGD